MTIDAARRVRDEILESYVNEGMALLGEGVPASVIERTALELGFREGPLAILDEISLDVADAALHQELHDLAHAAESQVAPHDHDHEHKHDQREKQKHEHERDDRRRPEHEPDHEPEHEHPRSPPPVSPSQSGAPHRHESDRGHDHSHGHDHEHAHGHSRGDGHGDGHAHAHAVKSKRMPESAVYVLEKMAHGYKRSGRAGGGGFYVYESDGGERIDLWSGLKTFERGAKKIAAPDVADRLLFAVALTALRALARGGVASEAEADAVAADALGSAGNGGPIARASQASREAFAARAQELAQHYGERFSPIAADTNTNG